MTLDGKIATRSRDSKISCEEDLLRVHHLRASVDAIIVGVETILGDNPRLTTHRTRGRNPMRVILDSTARTPLTARALTNSDVDRVLIAVTNNAPSEKVHALRSAGVDVVMTGSDNKVDVPLLMHALHERGVEKVLVEGGGTVNWSLLSLGLIDEIRVAVAPIIVGGKDSTTLVEGEGVQKIDDGINLTLQCIEQYGRDLVLTYKPTYKMV